MTTTPDSVYAPPLSREKIREIFLRNGFTVKDGQTDLKDYVYAAAAELLAATQVAAGAVSKQHVYDQFSFLEGLVSEENYRRICDTAVALSAPQGAQQAPAAVDAPDDASRLDWIEKMRHVELEMCRVGSATGPLEWGVEFGYSGYSASGANLREAIDAAIAAQEGGAK